MIFALIVLILAILAASAAIITSVQKTPANIAITSAIAIIVISASVIVIVADNNSTVAEFPAAPADGTLLEIQSEQAEYDSYQSILDDYTDRLKLATPDLVSEYKREARRSSGEIDVLAEICNDKISVLAEISNEGIGYMAELSLNSGFDDYDEYEEWVGRLTDVYSKQAEKITDAYMDSVL